MAIYRFNSSVDLDYRHIYIEWIEGFIFILKFKSILLIYIVVYIV